MSYEEQLHARLGSIFGSAVSNFTFELTARECSDFQLSDFFVKYFKKKKKCLVDDLLNAKKFRKIDCPLRSGVKYEAFIIPIKEDATYKEAILYMYMKKYLYLGPKILTVIQERYSQKIPRESWLYALDLESNLVKDKEIEERRVPCLINYQEESTPITLGKTAKIENTFEIAFAYTFMGFKKGGHLICIREVAV